jgi:hypothetical protein
MMAEYVYALSNPHMPGLIKVGRAADVPQRVAQLSAPSGVPGPFQVEHVIEVKDSVYAERDVHDVLVKWRLSFSREFFRCSVNEAKSAMAIAARVDASRGAEAEQFAEWLLARTDLNELPTIISWLQGTKPNDVIAALRREAA